MNKNQLKKYFKGIQILVWVILYLLIMLYVTRMHGFLYKFYASTIAVPLYIIVAYFNSNFLMPHFFKKSKFVWYTLLSLLLIVLIVLFKVEIENIILFPIHKTYYTKDISHYSLAFLTVTIAFLYGGFLHLIWKYICLLKKEESLRTQQLTTELHLLKQQVQPHFLYNTLNNIYSLANSKSDLTGVAIAKLAEMMRYFTEYAIKEKVMLQTEIVFIHNYIALEQLRILNPAQIHIDFTEKEVEIPSMLLIPFVENLFKHGIDKTLEKNEASIKITIEDNKLQFLVINNLCENHKSSGLGLINLRKRLDLLFDENYTLTTQSDKTKFKAFMEIPLQND